MPKLALTSPVVIVEIRRLTRTNRIAPRLGLEFLTRQILGRPKEITILNTSRLATLRPVQIWIHMTPSAATLFLEEGSQHKYRLAARVSKRTSTPAEHFLGSNKVWTSKRPRAAVMV